MSRGIKLKGKKNIVQGSGSHRLRVWVDSYEDIDPYIFVYQRLPMWPNQTTNQDVFTNIASVADLAEYPQSEPTTEPFFRLPSIDLIFRSVYDLERAWAVIQTDVAELVNNLNLLDKSGVDLEFVINNPEESSSSSYSSSSSIEDESSSSDSSFGISSSSTSSLNSSSSSSLG